jgi:hydroxyethylthiazole kinase-like sugar kinase family protein
VATGSIQVVLDGFTGCADNGWQCLLQVAGWGCLAGCNTGSHVVVGLDNIPVLPTVPVVCWYAVVAGGCLVVDKGEVSVAASGI